MNMLMSSNPMARPLRNFLTQPPMQGEAGPTDPSTRLPPATDPTGVPISYALHAAGYPGFRPRMNLRRAQLSDAVMKLLSQIGQ